ncbi:protein phosphatase 2C domain containing protein [Acanthamoeba castellanii str. Neff]|uniref:Protein phosphatase 2C domain containing protein n=1 Tax=Acanthamoeba castellanii (strain ATCC 30010 / Neff) TaxID=1257118 RepID=L8HL38_ACACF|nr:protein phosphatase 2C domain containing protein [Acanthamoeba castellanii str. Neff]ELR25388.1 protein phosphatase 2C domain containing protein [Acanthamoeba castellanii str. Neff]
MKGVLKRKGGSRVGGEESADVPFPGIRHHDVTTPPLSPHSNGRKSHTGSEDEDTKAHHQQRQDDEDDALASGGFSPPFPGVRFHLPSAASPSSSPHSSPGEERFRPLAAQAGRPAAVFAPARPQPYLLATHGGAASNIGCRETMEDAHAVHDRQGAPWRDLRKGRQAPTQFPNDCLSFYAVCDGHAGKTAANICAEVLPLKVAGTTAFAEGNFQEALKEGFKKADEVILATPDPGLAAAAAAERGAASLDVDAVSESQSPAQPAAVVTSPPARRLNKSNGGVGDGRLHIGQIKELKSMEKVGGSCVAACMVVGHRLFVANVGDCEAVLARWQPALEQYQGVVLTEKHRVSEKKERERIDNLGGTVIFGRLFGDLSVTRALGDREYKKPVQTEDFVSCDPHISGMRLRPDDEFVVMGCDGLWDHVAYDTAIEIVAALKKAGNSAEMAADALVREALDQHSTDNITCVVVYLDWQRTERPPSRIYMRSNSTNFHKRRSTTVGPNASPGSPAAPTSPGWVRSLPRGLSGSPSRREEARSPPVKPDKGEASLWRNKSSLGLKSAMTGGRSPNATHHLLDLGLAKKRVSVVVNWSSLKEEDLEELEDDGWILDDVDSKQDPSADGEEAEAEAEAGEVDEQQQQQQEGEDEGPEQQQVASPYVAPTAVADING